MCSVNLLLLLQTLAEFSFVLSLEIVSVNSAFILLLYLMFFLFI